MCLCPKAPHIIVEIPPRKHIFPCKPGKQLSHGASYSSQRFCEGTVHITYLIKSLFCLPYSEAVSFCEVRICLKSGLSQASSTLCTPFLASSIDLPHSMAICYYFCGSRSMLDAN